MTIIERKIVWGDLDSLGIVFYPRYYEWMDEASHHFFDSMGLNLVKLWKEKGLIFGLIETGCKYLSPGRYGDMIHLETRLDKLEAKTLTLNHTIYRMPGKELMVEGFERRVCLDVCDPMEFKAIKIPREIQAILEGGAAKGPSSTRASSLSGPSGPGR